ncbi:fasciclin domain-containing protein [Autumnicola psychrophila]|uniref:Fasciclin domain-containing protein n=1 Tax=Autumnicola psychrophila TaxID=3075592 RepID=A0ABU3DTY1_9FLAO|nr:fasciclin domain-containing protein [Zunongwangia sp. F225]MDT0687172.1 fasciclin domain-containing protein [Zunongwangia sp. F225]
MKLNKIYYLLILAMITSLSSCEDDDDLYPQLGEDPRNINEVLAETADLSVLYQSLVEAEMDSLLRETTTYTVFAPRNAAFDQADLSGLDQEERENLLSNHVLSTVTADFASTLSTGYRPTMATGPNGNFLSLYINTEGETTLNGDVSLVTESSNKGATNGVLHVVDGILTPPAILDHVEANNQFSTFMEAVELAGLTDMLSATEVTDAENPDYPLTVFAPTNAAFENFLGDLNGAFGWTTLADIPTDVLRSVLEQHVITGSNLISAEVFGTEQTPVSGEVFSVSAQGVVSDASYTDGNVTVQDIQGTNGVIHGVDKVMLTEAVFQSILDETLNLKERIEDRGYTSFIAAAEKAGLMETLETEELTAFIPSNAAFDSFLSVIENFESLEDFETPEEIELLKSVLEYHLHEGRLMSSSLTDGPLTTTQGDELIFDTATGRLTPSYEFAPKATLETTNIGASNGIIHQISNVLVSAEDAEALGYPVPATGGPEYGYEIYHDALNPGFWVGWTSPDFANTENVYSGNNSIKLDYAAYEALQIGNDEGIDLSAFTTINFALYSENGTSVLLALNGNNDAGQVLSVPAGEWTEFSIPIANVSDGATTLTQFVLQDQSGEAGTLYYDQIGLDVTVGEAPAPTFALPVYLDEETESGFQNTWNGWGGTWTWNSTEQVQNGTSSIKLEYFADSWGALQIGGAEGVNASDYSTFEFSAYGAPGSGTTPLLVNLGGSDDGVSLDVIEGEWTTYSFPVSQFPDTSLGEIRFKNTSAEARTIFIDNIGFNN